MERNLGELPALIELGASLGVDRIKGHHLWVHFGDLQHDDLRRSPDSRRRWNETLVQCFRAAREHLRPDGTRILLDNFLPLPETGSSELPAEWGCPFLGREAWVNHAGRFDPCCAPDAERQALGSFGIVGTDGGFTTIWESPKYRGLVSRYQDEAVCRKCTLRRPIGGRGDVASISGIRG